jgi:hypothetical protein
MVQAEEQIQRTKDVKDEEERAKLLEAEFDYLVSTVCNVSKRA